MACCSPWSRKDLDTAEQLNWTESMVSEWIKNTRRIKETEEFLKEYTNSHPIWKVEFWKNISDGLYS